MARFPRIHGEQPLQLVELVRLVQWLAGLLGGVVHEASDKACRFPNQSHDVRAEHMLQKVSPRESLAYHQDLGDFLIRLAAGMQARPPDMEAASGGLHLAYAAQHLTSAGRRCRWPLRRCRSRPGTPLVLSAFTKRLLGVLDPGSSNSATIPEPPGRSTSSTSALVSFFCSWSRMAPAPGPGTTAADATNAGGKMGPTVAQPTARAARPTSWALSFAFVGVSADQHEAVHG